MLRRTAIRAVALSVALTVASQIAAAQEHVKPRTAQRGSQCHRWRLLTVMLIGLSATKEESRRGADFIPFCGRLG